MAGVYFLALAADYDGTTAHHGRVDRATVRALESREHIAEAVSRRYTAPATTRERPRLGLKRDLPYRSISICLLMAIAQGCTLPTNPRRPPPGEDPGDSADVATARDSAVVRAIDFAVRQMRRSMGELTATQHASATRPSDGSWSSTGPSSWTSGFFAGTQWLLYELTSDEALRARAEAQTEALAGQELNGADHDIGFRIVTSFGQGHRLLGNPAYRETILTAAGTFGTLFDPLIGMTRSQRPRSIGTDLACRDPVSVGFPVIIDNLMNLELFFMAAAEGGGSAFREMATSHALRASEHHMRADGSTWQYVDFDTVTAEVRFKGTHQGYCDDSTWARGQSWAVYGFSMAYRYTRDPRFLDAARRAADYFIDNLPADRVPYWDFELPAPGAGTPKEASAAAVAAAGLLELGDHVPGPDRYRAAGLAILDALVAPPYLAEGTLHRSVLLHSNANVNTGSEVDVGQIYADYYFLEALLRYRRSAEPAGAGR